MKKSKDDLIKSVESLEGLSDDSKIKLMEDLDDSIEDMSKTVDSLNSKIESLNKDVEIWKEKYKDRFLNSEEIVEKKEELEEPEPEEIKERIDIKEI